MPWQSCTFPRHTASPDSKLYSPIGADFTAELLRCPRSALDVLQVASPHELGLARSTVSGLFGSLYPIYVRGEAATRMVTCPFSSRRALNARSYTRGVDCGNRYALVAWFALDDAEAASTGNRLRDRNRRPESAHPAF